MMGANMSLFILLLYVAFLLLIGKFTGGTNSNSTFFTSDRNASWVLVAIGMVGASLSGVTFISIPGEVGSSNLYYFQIVLGYMVGYTVIALVLIPLYYKLGLVSIYEYLGRRFGVMAQRSGSTLFLVSQALGASLRLLVVALVLQTIIFKPLGIPFFVSVAGILLLIWLYTRKGGIKTIVYTDVLQTIFIVAALIGTLGFIISHLNLTIGNAFALFQESPMGTVFDFDLESESFILKHFVSGILIAVVMTGLDQNMMQKSLACKSVGEAQKNVFLFSVCLLITNLLFLLLGFFLYRYADKAGLQLFDKFGGLLLDTDKVYGIIAMDYAPVWVGLLFLLGVVAAAFSSADSSLTALTTSIYHDFFKNTQDSSRSSSLRKRIHVCVAAVVYVIVLVMFYVKDDSIINYVLLFAGYTYGPLLGLFCFGLVTKYHIHTKTLPFICILAPILTYLINLFGKKQGFELGFIVLLVNGLLTYAMLYFLKLERTDKNKII